MNSKAIGDKAENEVVKILEDYGFLVQKAWRKMIRITNNKTKKSMWVSKTNDFFGCFDIIAMNVDTIKLVQVTTDNELGLKRKKIKTFCEELFYPFSYVTKPYKVEIWCRIKENNKVKYRIYTFPKFLKKDSYVVMCTEYPDCNCDGHYIWENKINLSKTLSESRNKAIKGD